MAAWTQRSFAGGEISESLYTRVDLTKYATGARKLRNMMVLKHGGAANRSGTIFICEVKDSTKRVRLIPFIFNNDQTYMLEFGDQYMRVIRDSSQLTKTAQGITGITNANPAVLTYSGSDTYSNGDHVFVSGIVGPIGTYLNNRTFKVASVNTGANTFQLQYLDGTNVNSTLMGAYTSGGTIAEIYEIATPYLEADLQSLQFVQSADVITIVHKNYPPAELARTGHTSWTLTNITFAPAIAAPGSPSNSGSGGSVTEWVITAIADENFEESLQSSATSTADTPTSGSPITVSWSAVTGASEYNVYKKTNGVYGLIGVAAGTSFIDTGITADATNTPPQARNPFAAPGDYPGAVTYVQQRLGFADTENNPERAWLSRSGLFKNFTVSSPVQDDDAVTFTLAGRQVNEIKHMIDLDKMVVLTTGSEVSINGDDSGIIKPTAINPKTQTYYGSGDLRPIIIGANALFVQARGSIVRDLNFLFESNGYRGNDLTIFASHLFDLYTLSDWDYQQTPNSIVWIVRDDGKIVALTYIPEQQILGWHQHDFGDDLAENVATIPEGNEDLPYFVVKRTINGTTKRYIERMSTRKIQDIRDAIFMDAALTYDGRNVGSTTMTLSGGVTWAYTEPLTLTASASFFTSDDVGNSIFLYDADGNQLRCTIQAYTSATVVTVLANKTVPVAFRSTALLEWSRAVDTLSGLWHLEGQEVSVLADAFVAANPNNSSYTVVTVTNGQITLDRAYAVIQVGLPYLSDLETLDIDTTQGETMMNKKKQLNAVGLYLEASRGVFAGNREPTDGTTTGGLYELKIRANESLNDPVDLVTGYQEIGNKPDWNSNGRCFIRQIDPLPLTVLAAVPVGFFPVRGQ